MKVPRMIAAEFRRLTSTRMSVIALLAWLSLHSMVALLGAELNQVLPFRRLAAAEPATSVTSA